MISFCKKYWDLWKKHGRNGVMDKSKNIYDWPKVCLANHKNDFLFLKAKNVSFFPASKRYALKC